MSSGPHELNANERDAVLRAMVEGIPQIAWASGPDRQATYLNRKWYDYTGQSPEKDFDPADFVHPDDLKKIRDQIVSVPFGDPIEQEIRLLRRDGEYRWHLMRVESHRSPTGEVLGFFGTSSYVHDLKVAEAALQDQLRVTRTIAENADSPLLLLDKTGLITYANPAFYRTTGFAPGHMLGACAHDLLHARDFSAIQLIPGTCPANFVHDDFSRLRNLEETLVRADGSPFSAIVCVTPIVDAEGRAQGGVLEFRDVSEEKERESALLRMQESLNLAMTGGLQGWWSCDLSTQVVVWSSQLEGLFGLAKGSFEGTHDAFLTRVHPEDRSRLNEAIGLAIKAMGEYIVEFRFAKADGEERWMEARGRAFGDETGRATHLFGTGMDITDRRRAADALRESEAHYRFMVDSNPQVPWTADPVGRLTDVSDKWLQVTGFSRQEAMLKGWTKVIHTEDLPRIFEAWSHAISTGEPYDIEHRIQLEDGTVTWMRSRAVPRRDKDGKIIRWYGSTENIEAQKLVESELSRLVEERTQELTATNAALIVARDDALAAFKAKGEFLANVSHEIRTPMNGVIGMTSLLLDRMLDEDTRSIVQIIDSSGHTLLRVIDDLLDFSKMEADKLEIEPASVDVAELAADVVALYQAHAEAMGVSLATVPPSVAAPRVMADPIRLRQILSNLISNAIKFSQGGRVDLEWACQGVGSNVHTQIVVRDTGIGISPDRLDAVFDSFTQADGSTQRRYGGTGLGLAISKRLVELMGGTISLASEVGVGSTFTIDLSFDLAEASEARPVPRQVSAEVQVSLRVLLAEDNAVNVQVAKRVLERCGCLVDVAENGLRAISLASAANYDLILMDVQMPLCDGLEATRAIRQTEVREGLVARPIIALTANAMSKDRDECLAAGMSGFLAKPIKIADIEAMLAQVRAGLSV